MCTAEEVRGRPLPYEEFRDALVAVARRRRLRLDDEPLAEGERTGVDEDRRQGRVSDEPSAASRPTASRAEAPRAPRSASATTRAASCAGPASPSTARARWSAAMLAGDMHVSPARHDRPRRRRARRRRQQPTPPSSASRSRRCSTATTSTRPRRHGRHHRRPPRLRREGHRGRRRMRPDEARRRHASSSPARRRASARPPRRCSPTRGRPARAHGRGAPTGSRRSSPTLPGDGHDVRPRDLADPDAAERRASCEDASVTSTSIVHNAGDARSAATSPTSRPTRCSETMDLNFFTPVRMTLATLPRMLERGRGCHVYVSSLGGRLGHRRPRRRTAPRSSPSPAGPRPWPSTCGTRRSTSASSSPAPSTPRSGTCPATTRRSTTAPLEPPSTVAEAIADAIEGDALRGLQPRHARRRRVEDRRHSTASSPAWPTWPRSAHA